MIGKREVALLLLPAGFGVWLFALSALYALFSIGCERGWHQTAIVDTDLLRILLVLLWLAFFPLLGGIYRWCRRELQAAESDESRFLWRASLWCTIGSAVALFWLGPFIFFASVCV